MAVVAALLERRGALLSLRRTLPRDSIRVLTARSPAGLAGILSRHRVDAVVIGTESLRSATFDALRRDFVAIPVILYAPMRSDDAPLLRRGARHGLAGLLVEGVDEPVASRLIRTAGLTGRREAALLPHAARLDLTDPLQLNAWRTIVHEAPGRLSTAVLARRLGVTRETLSRRFSAGRAPSLKQALDTVRLIAAGELMACAGYTVTDVARLLGYSSAALLQRTAQRMVGRSARQLSAASPAALLAPLEARPGPAWR